MQGITEKFVDTGEVRIHYAAGPDNGPPLVLIPGQSMCWESYLQVLPALMRRFQVYAIDIRGHGLSGRTPGNYNYRSIGRDMEFFLREVVQRPAIISGNSSGGVIALWCAANLPDRVIGVVPEDPPLFSSEWPRLRDGCWAYGFFKLVVDGLDGPHGRDMGYIFRNFEVPTAEGARIIRIPRWLAWLLSWLIDRYEKKHPGAPIDIGWLPMQLRVLIKSFSTFDPNFTRAFIDGSACASIDHTAVLKAVRCPMLLLHADWFIQPGTGLLLGAMSDDDVRRTRELAPQCDYRRIRSGHSIHIEKPRIFIAELLRFAEELKEK